MVKVKQAGKVITLLIVYLRNPVQYDFQKHKYTAGRRISCLFAVGLNLFFFSGEGTKNAFHFDNIAYCDLLYCLKKARSTYLGHAGTEC